MSGFGLGEGSNPLTPHQGVSPGFTNMQQFPNDMSSPFNADSFQQPFVPQDLWQMPMTLEWDWADMTGMGYPPVDPNDGAQQNGGP